MGLLETNGLSLEILSEPAEEISENNLNAFEKESLLQDAFAAAEWFDASEALEDVLYDRQK